MSQFILFIIFFFSTNSLSDGNIVTPDNIVGKWKCEETYGNNDLFSFNLKITSEFKKPGEYIKNIESFYDYRSKGTIDITFQINGSWILENDVLKVINESVDVIYLNNQLTKDNSKSDDEMKLHLKNNYQIDDESIFKVLEYSENKITYLNKEEKFSCQINKEQTLDQ